MTARTSIVLATALLVLTGCPARPSQPDAADAPSAPDAPRADIAPADAAPDAPRDDGPLPPDVPADSPPLDAADAPIDSALDATDATGLDAPVVPDAPSDAALDAALTDAPIFTDAACGATFNSYPDLPGVHVSEDAGLTFVTNPPAGGDHYPIWARWGLHTEVVPRGYWLHNVEHGGTIVLYRCDGDCGTVRAALEAVIAALPPEPLCTSGGEGVTRRVVLTEDPLLDVAVAASAYSWTYRASCVDPPSLTAFVLARTGHAPEETCAQGSYP